MARDFVMGLDGVLYRDDAFAAVPGSSTGWTEITNVQDVTLSITADTSDATSRASSGWRQMISTLRSGTIDFSILWTPDDANIDNLWSDFISGCAHPWLITDGPPATECTGTATADIWRFHAWFVMSGFDWNQSLTDPMTADVTMEIAPGMVPAFAAGTAWS